MCPREARSMRPVAVVAVVAVVAEQEATWADPATGAERRRAVVTSEFLVADGVITRFRRHDDGLPAALTAAGLRQSHEVTSRAG